MRNAEIIDTTAHLLAGEIIRGGRELDNRERDNLEAARMYITEMLGDADLTRAEKAAFWVCRRWRE